MKGKILVTGGTGYIGSHSTVELQNAGYEVVIIDNLSNSNIEVLDGIERITGKRPTFVQADCTDMEALRQLFKENPGIKGIIHFAASKAVGESVQKPLLYYRNNLMSLVNLLTLMPEYGVEGIVFSSSCTVYGQPDVLPVDESAPIKPALSPYGNTKQICEEIIKDTIHASAPFKSIILRYFNPNRGTPNRRNRRTAQRRSPKPYPILDPNRHRYPQRIERIRRRLSYSRRFLHSRLHQRRRSCKSSCDSHESYA